MSDEASDLFTLPLKLDALVDGAMPVDAVVIVKYLCPDCSAMHLSLRNSHGLSKWEALGMLRAAVVTYEDDLRRSFESEDDDDDDS